VAITPSNICQGPATLYWAPFGTTEPAYTAIGSPPAAPWTDVGGIADGTAVLLEIDQTYSDISVDQLVDPVGARLTKRVIQLTAQLEETTLQNLQFVMNQNLTLNVQSGYTVADPITTTSATQPYYTALILDGWAPTTGTTEVECRRRIVLRKSLSQAKADLEYQKSKPAMYQCTFTSYFVSTSIAPFEITDATS
jgi:hypothetical protein